MPPEPGTPGLLERILVPRPLFAGVVTAFVVCCLLGRLAASRNSYETFQRFHRFINTETQFYPTASQVCALGRARLEPNRVAVVVGGNSILFGTGQRPSHLWTERLQELLGDRYRVLNLATVGARPWEFGGLAAEMLLRERPRLVFVTGVRAIPLGPRPRPDGYAYQHLFWDGTFKGLVPPDAGREQRLAELLRDEKANPGGQELRLRQRLDSLVYANDLWTTTAYRWVSTPWCPDVAANFLRPRCRYADPDQEVVAPAAFDPTWLAEAQRLAEGCDAANLVEGIGSCLPAALRPRTCVLVVHGSPRYTGQLEPDLQARYRDFFPAAVQGLTEQGLSAVEVGADYTETDYHDGCHLSETGGTKLAAQVAVEVRHLAERLGYLDGED